MEEIVKERAALIIVDVQNDFCPGGALAVPRGDEVVGVLNGYIEAFSSRGYPVLVSRDFHPRETGHFKGHGGRWPPHCVQGTGGAEFHPGLRLPEDVIIITKGDKPDEDAYSAFQGRDSRGRTLCKVLEEEGIGHVFVGGLATDYCVKETVLDALKNGLKATLLIDAVRGVDVNPGDSERAVEEMKRNGADTVTLDALRLP